MKFKDWVRDHSNMTNTEVARQLGVHRTALYNYYKGRFPQQNILEKIIKMTDSKVMPNDFLEK